ncbi:Twitching motility protein PilT [hydrothermal vent metagenome]|uniref:Twitching motility protein PilT n=1 Tax=hydrothermal vent metagenome TaxID=652676 RepID=A0A3B0VWN8_9ZZZZ
MDLTHFLKTMRENNGSDMYLTTGAPINVKTEGVLEPMSSTGLPPGIVEKIAYSLMDERQIKEFEATMECNLAVSIKGVGRYRVNVFRQRGEVGMVIRTIKSEIPKLEELHMPPHLYDLIMEKRGLILVVGATGSGKSTTMASMIDYRNSTTTGHILTIEDPIEYVHKHKKSVVNQREIGIDTLGYAPALKNALREAPDVILIGEINNSETMEAAISFAETGHLCMATLHANNSDQAMERALNFFPSDMHNNVLMNLALNLKAVISQRLVVDVDGKRRPACEVLMNTPQIRELIRKGKINELKAAMDQSLDDGMQTFDQALYDMYKNGIITLEEALTNADSSQGLDVRINLTSEDDTASDDYF